MVWGIVLGEFWLVLGRCCLYLVGDGLGYGFTELLHFWGMGDGLRDGLGEVVVRFWCGGWFG